MRALKVLLVCAAVLPSACSDGTGPEPGVDETQLEFVRFPSDLLPLVTSQASFWAVKGEDRILVMRYLPEQPGEEGEEFLEFRVAAQSLLRRPDGTLFQDGDSVLISVLVSPDGRFLFQFEPSGLRFDPDRPARLKIVYRRTEGDLDDDGDVDDDDDDLEQRLRLWRQESPGAPWYPVGSIRLHVEKEVEGLITGFTGFAIAG
ncbi:MAG TPA: hypothetical protein VFZ24_13330 [Longimicrobiales bacterium]